ncbi:MAG: hypothetical protein A3H98_11305 [Bacteroidetes bacterium RIFCSPLOWO2_02_FULL_36_8]|nr:MAG: hypothetical protein A3H98_11305 [Bacteroidetes bacterium RIFCSPLOWO2_02_FULL_36_8]OFY69112.1 MAG: hypothetical protein A3G23_06065 [Bacteroidetes bacterium RIFCSPLOWO2_12_FULL_37_12]
MKATIKTNTIRLLLCLLTISLFPAIGIGQKSQTSTAVPSKDLYLKAFKVRSGVSFNQSGVTSVNEFAYVLSKGVSYVLTSSQAENPNVKMRMQLFDRNHKLLASNFDEGKKKFYSAIQYKCTTSGLHYLAFSCEGSGGAGEKTECKGEGILKFSN